MRKNVTILILIFLAYIGYAQEKTGINTTDPKATLDVVGSPTNTNILDGIIAPRLTGAQLKGKTYTYSQRGAMVYVTRGASGTNLAGQTINVKEPGVYIFNGIAWIKLVDKLGYLEKLTENGNTGYRIRGVNATNYGNIGKDAVDLSTSNGSSSTLGATGFYSTAIGHMITSSGYYSTVGGGVRNQATQNSSTIGGGNNNIASEQNSTVGGGYGNTASGSTSTIGGGNGNTTSAYASTVGGGNNNAASGYASNIAGGRSNQASQNYSTVGGGYNNTSSSEYSTVGGGYENIASGQHSTVGGGRNNKPEGVYSIVGGGFNNTARGSSSTVGGGTNNLSNASSSTTIGGGAGNNAMSNYATVGGGHENTASGQSSTIGGGYKNTASEIYSTVSGGLINRAWGRYSTVVGGLVLNAQSQSTIALGQYNTLENNPEPVAYSQNNKRLLVLGNGIYISPVNSNNIASDAFTVLRNGKVGIDIDHFEDTTSDAKLQVNGDVKITGVTKLDPQNILAGGTCENGSIGYGTDGEFYACKNSIWMTIVLNN